MKKALLFLVGSLSIISSADQGVSLLGIITPYKYGDTDQSRALRAEVWKWDYHFAREIQKKNEAMSLAFDGANLHANTSHESLLYYTHRVHCLAWCVTNHQQAVEFTNAVERWITNLPSGPE